MSGPRRSTRPSYRRALSWIIENDDTEWLDPGDGGRLIPSVTTVLIADLFDQDDEKVIRDLRREMTKRRGE